MKTLTSTTLIFCVSIPISIGSISLAQSNSCVWAGRVYSDTELKQNGRVCQICENGKWIDNATDCNKCVPTTTPKQSNPAATALDCTAQRSPSDKQKLTFSDGARTEQQSGSFQMCSAGQWTEKTPLANQICGGNAQLQNPFASVVMSARQATVRTAPSSSYDPPGELSSDYPKGGVTLGSGWSLFDDKKTSSVCIAFKPDVAGKGQETSMDLQDVVDSYSLMHELKISASVQVKGVIGNVTAKSDFAQKVEVKDDSAYFTVYVLTMNGARFVAPIENEGGGASIHLPSKYLEMAKNDYKKFMHECGDSYVSSINEGAELDARLQFDVHSASEKTSLAASLDGSLYGTEFSAKVSTAMDTYNSQQKLHILYHQTGGSGAPIPTDKPGLLKAIQDVAKSAQDAPKPYTVSLERYETLPDWPHPADSSTQRDLETLARQHGKFKTLYYLAESIKSDPSQFVMGRGVTIEQVQKVQDDVSDHLRSLEDKAKACFASESVSCQVEDKDMVPDYSYLILFPPRKGFAGDNNRNIALQQIDAANARIKQFQDDIASGGLAKVIVGQTNLPVAKAELAAAQAAFTKAESEYPAAIKEAVKDQWIVFTSASRCHSKATAPDCLSNSQIDAYAAKIKAQ